MRRVNGYSLLELLLALVLLSLVMGSIYAVLRDQSHYYAVQAGTGEVRDAVRIAGTLFTSELRHASPASDFYSIEPDSLELRSTVGVGVLCAASVSAGLEIRVITGSFGDGRADSVSLYHELDPSHPDGSGSWKAAAVRRVEYGPGGTCLDGAASDLALRLESADEKVADLSVGTPVRAFRPYVYRLYQRRGRWWLGQGLRGGSIQPVVGPLADPESGGLRLEYLDADGAGAASARAVRVVRLTLKSTRTFHFPRPWTSSTKADSVVLIVYLRNS